MPEPDLACNHDFMDSLQPTNYAVTVVYLQSALWNGKQFKVVDDHFSPDFVAIWPTTQTSGREDFKKLVNMYLNAFPDLIWTSQEVISDANQSAIVQRWTLTGTFTKEFQSLQPNLHKISWHAISIIHVDNDEGKISSIRTFYDRKSFLEALSAPK